MDFIHINIIDIVDIFLVAMLMFQLYRLIRGTSAIGIFAGILIVYLLWIVIRALGMELLSLILGQVIGVGVIALIIVFQPEIRRFLLLLGNKYAGQRGSFIKHLLSSERTDIDERKRWIQELATACGHMSMTKTGVLIVIGRNNDVQSLETGGQKIDAIISADLLENIFFKNSPLHDGAVVIYGDRLAAARCLLPTSERADIPSYLGTRHRAAIGASELTDSIVIVVSEETGTISMVENGDIVRGLSEGDLRLKLSDKLVK